MYSGSESSSSSLFQNASANHHRPTIYRRLENKKCTHGATGSSATTSTRGTFVSAPSFERSSLSSSSSRIVVVVVVVARRRRMSSTRIISRLRIKRLRFSSSSSHNEGVTSKSAITKRVEESVNLPPPRISDLPRAPNERVCGKGKVGYSRRFVADHHGWWWSEKHGPCLLHKKIARLKQRFTHQDFSSERKRRRRKRKRRRRRRRKKKKNRHHQKAKTEESDGSSCESPRQLRGQ